MAVDYTYVWCVSFGEANDYWLSSLGTFEQYMSQGYSCGRTWTVIKTTDFQAILSAQGGPVVSSFTAEEVAALKFQANNPSPFNLSISDGALVSGAIVGTWAVAWAARQFVRALGSDGEE
ncbi:hypothetical protein [Aquabacterium sp.]|uniref:hypothetical protein n=1 Tax=Aquabacterium sp. TaxID=1872578 RepID=UPI0025C1414E|nr:hypothetical protein [Aquabacterium sp.]